MHAKDFDRWNEKKKHVEATERIFYVKEREIWWCMLGVNVGREIDGKNDVFERPVLNTEGLEQGNISDSPTYHKRCRRQRS